MATQADLPAERRLSDPELAVWRTVPTAVLSDELDHQGVLAGLRPLHLGMAFAGQALTIQTDRVDNGAPRRALGQAWPGAAIVIDARAHPATAVWGGNLAAIARTRRVIAIVVDGNVRDTADLRASGLAVFSRGVTPVGPAWGGHIDVPIDCGSVRVLPGDLVVGDDDGVVVVPLSRVTDDLLARCRARIARDEAFQASLAAGRTPRTEDS